MPEESVLQKISSVDSWYHVIEVAPGVVTPGAYDMRPSVSLFQFPESLAGKTVLDVGPANGFYSFMFEKLGAEQVVAVDLKSWADHDFPRWYVDENRPSASAERIAHIDHHELHGGFEVAHELLSSKVEKRYHRIYELADSLDMRFDVVFCGCMLVHCMNPIGALEAVRSVLKPDGKLILSTPIDASVPESSYAVLVADHTCPAWWVPSQAALMKMVQAAGFTVPEWKGSFKVTRRFEPKITDVIGIVHARGR